jgi:hypothetical protein
LSAFEVNVSVCKHLSARKFSDLPPKKINAFVHFLLSLVHQRFFLFSIRDIHRYEEKHVNYLEITPYICVNSLDNRKREGKFKCGYYSLYVLPMIVPNKVSALGAHSVEAGFVFRQIMRLMSVVIATLI